ncbi:MAG: 5-(carboxyamino)imidazole ribonucleotide mutase [Candidatus Aenigmarchaeota archaeon]|nr:5-(carboxyamino)imidazole ribonucleotide mutase [Candidatus Aenigmarchaeota archaeon]
MPKPFVPIIMGSKTDLEHAKKIGKELDLWKVDHTYHVASAHKHPRYALGLMGKYDTNEELSIVYITIAGRSDALSGLVSANTINPVIACPPYSEKFAGADIYSSLRMPSKAPAMVVLEPENAASAAVKIFALSDENLKRYLHDQLIKTKDEIEKADHEIS